MQILVVDDDPRIVSLLRRNLQELGHQVIAISDGLEALRVAHESQPDVILLDVVIPHLDGVETCRRLREISDVPIIILSALGKEADVVRGLNAGADDYLTKPFSMEELMARLDATLRRAANQRAPLRPMLYDDGVLRIDLNRQIALKRGKRIALSPKEFQLLACFVRNMGRVISHEQLLQEVWGSGYEGQLSYLALYIFYLRQKIEDDPSAPVYIQTRFRVGYCFRSDRASDTDPSTLH